MTMTHKEMFNFGKYTFICWSWSKSQRYDYRGNPIEEPLWGHKVELYNGAGLVATAKVGYYNRTWEKYTYQSAMYQAFDKYKREELKHYLLNNKFKMGLAECNAETDYNTVEKPFKAGQKKALIEQFEAEREDLQELAKHIEEGK
jgi:hypothetical protein